MGWGTGNLGGGSEGLNFKIVSYATESELLADTPKENTIGVITSIPITGYHFGTEEPSPAAEGMVWITTGTSSSVGFNALKKNAIQVYPLSANQYVSGAWVSVEAKAYQNGEWIDFILTLFPNENTTWVGSTSGEGKTEIESGTLGVKEQWISINQHQQIATKEKYDVTGYSKLCGRIKSSECSTTKAVALLPSTGTSIQGGSVAARASSNTTTAGDIIVCDVSAVIGEYHVAVGQYTSSGASNNFTYFDKVWLE